MAQLIVNSHNIANSILNRKVTSIEVLEDDLETLILKSYGNVCAHLICKADAAFRYNFFGFDSAARFAIFLNSLHSQEVSIQDGANLSVKVTAYF